MRRWLLKLHRWAGLVAGLWLLVLGATGVLLGHPEWRWQWHVTVPQEWLSQPVGRLLRGTIMRHVISDPDDPRAMLGASERGTWWTTDGGATWTAVSFDGLSRTPMVFAIVAAAPVSSGAPGEGAAGDPFAGAWLATDDGLWITGEYGRSAHRAGLEGLYVNSLTRGAAPGELVGVVDRSRLFRLDTGRLALAPRWVPVDDVRVSGLPERVDLFGFTFDLHFGEALLQRATALKVNDFAGIALVVLPLTGLLYWWLPRRWRRECAADAAVNRARRVLLGWLYRFHAPMLGVLAAIPILYVSVTGAALGHVEWFEGWAKDVELRRERLLWTYRFASLEHEVYQVVADPRDPARLTITTRLGLLDSTDGGASWQRDAALAAARFNLFRSENHVFASLRAGEHWYRVDGEQAWRTIAGPTTVMTSATRSGGAWTLKNSRGFWRGELGQPMRLEETLTMPALAGATFFLFAVDLHTGNLISTRLRWVNDFVALLVVVLVLTGPILWWRAKWR
jgi:hypothetical protein